MGKSGIDMMRVDTVFKDIKLETAAEILGDPDNKE